MFARDKHSSLFGLFIADKDFMTLAPDCQQDKVAAEDGSQAAGLGVVGHVHDLDFRPVVADCHGDDDDRAQAEQGQDGGDGGDQQQVGTWCRIHNPSFSF